jgi:hypothetical protein
MTWKQIDDGHHMTLSAFPLKLHGTSWALPALLAVFLLTIPGCNQGDDGTMSNRDIKTVMEANATDLMSNPDVSAVAIGELPDGTPCIKVYVVNKSDAVVKKIPDRLEGHPVVIEESGEFKPMADD